MIRPVTEYHYFDKRKPWLVVGKGPSIDLLEGIEEFDFNIIAINQAQMKLGSLSVMSFIDYEPFLEMYGYARGSAAYRALWCPWHPHWMQEPTKRTLLDFLKFDSQLRMMAKHGLLFSYNLSNAPDLHPNLPTYRAGGFSIEVILQIIGDLGGSRDVYSVGIDGGKDRHAYFQSNYREHEVSYDQQWEGIRKVCSDQNLSFTKWRN